MIHLKLCTFNQAQYLIISHIYVVGQTLTLFRFSFVFVCVASVNRGVLYAPTGDCGVSEEVQRSQKTEGLISALSLLFKVLSLIL